MKKEEFLTGTVYLGGVGSPIQPVEATLTQVNIIRREGDQPPPFLFPTKGYEGRQYHVQQFLASDHDFLFMFDLDMRFPPDVLERLRRHGRALVTARYIRRSVQPMMPIWFAHQDKPAEEWLWPLRPWTDKGNRHKGALVKLGATGFGAVLIHRTVFEAMEPLLKGEQFIIEDDMDVWPYELTDVLAGKEQLRPLRGVKENCIGSDLRFCFFAWAAGFQLWGDPELECDHYINYPLSCGDFDKMSENVQGEHGVLVERIDVEVEKERKRMAGIHRTLRAAAKPAKNAKPKAKDDK
jgi:hypothetical protein